MPTRWIGGLNTGAFTAEDIPLALVAPTVAAGAASIANPVQAAVATTAHRLIVRSAFTGTPSF